MTVEKPIQTQSRDGVNLAYLDIGAGDPPLLFIHGWCCDRSYWRDQLLEFQGRHRTVAVDLRGHGDSDKPDQDYTIAGFVDDMAWLSERIGLERPVIVGHSMGGVIGLNLVRKHPGLARGLVMVDSPVVPLPDAFRATEAAIFAGLNSPAYVDVAKGFVGNVMFRADSDPTLKQTIVDGMALAPQRVMLTALRDVLSAANMAPGPISVPALFARATTATASAGEITARYPGLRVEEFDAAHFLQMEKPDAFNEILGAFVGEVA
ncbi:MAG TPA: alpha/beta hydrolase [Dehalococcoidia bacterium]|nr:alpha/beta hydrolase [Dehalococcoidia bacterium]